MAYRNFTPGEFYHLYNRGVDGRKIFLDTEDHKRFLECIKELNDNTGVSLFDRHVSNQQGWEIKRGDPVVNILAYTLLPNHFHIFFYIPENGDASLFLQKVGVSFTKYFNKKYSRTGPLFSGKMKTAHVDNERYHEYITHYIHLNILDLINKKWRSGKLNLTAKEKKFLHSYKWTSLPSYLTHVNDDILQNDIVRELFPNTEEYKKNLYGWAERETQYHLE
jgi:putative transposase